MMHMPNISMTAVVAMAENHVIGDGKRLLWNIPEDLKRVKMLTMGCPLIMGRKTWDSIGRALPGRASIIMTRDVDWIAEGVIPVQSMKAAIAAAKDWIISTASSRHEIILFGGGDIYRQGLQFCNRIERTIVALAPDGGTDAAFFPFLSESEWEIVVESSTAARADVPAFRYESATRINRVNLHL